MKRCATGQYFVNRCSSCPSGFNYNLGKCFKLSTDSLQMGFAGMQCQNQNAELALPNSDAKFDYLKSLGSDNGFWVL